MDGSSIMNGRRISRIMKGESYLLKKIEGMFCGGGM